MIRLLAPLLAIALFAAGCDSHDHGAPAPSVKKLDPVCGMESDPATAKIKASHEGKEFGFCSDTCKTTFEKEPSRYAMGFCPCGKTMPDCSCGHCKALAAKKAPTERCACGDEKHDEHKH